MSALPLSLSLEAFLVATHDVGLLLPLVLLSALTGFAGLQNLYYALCSLAAFLYLFGAWIVNSSRQLTALPVHALLAVAYLAVSVTCAATAYKVCGGEHALPEPIDYCSEYILSSIYTLPPPEMKKDRSWFDWI